MADSTSPTVLTAESLPGAADWLAAREPVLRAIIRRLGLPPFWTRPAGFPGLVRIILEQQVSLASARAAYERMEQALPELTPAAFLTLDESTLRQIGFSRQKGAYCRGLAQTVLKGDLDLEALAALDDEHVRTALIQLKGIGNWTADIYLLLSLQRADLWPVQDLGLIGGMQRGYSLAQPPTRQEMLDLGETFRPYRSVATRLFWHLYLSGG